MFTRLYDMFPEINIKDISKDGKPAQLYIWCRSPTYGKGTEDEHFVLMQFIINCVNENDREEPYTQETLEKAIIEFPIKYKEYIKELDKKYIERQERKKYIVYD